MFKVTVKTRFLVVFWRTRWTRYNLTAESMGRTISELTRDYRGCRVIVTRIT